MPGEHIHKWVTVGKPPIVDGGYQISAVPWLCDCGAVEHDGRLGPKESISLRLGPVPIIEGS